MRCEFDLNFEYESQHRVWGPYRPVWFGIPALPLSGRATRGKLLTRTKPRFTYPTSGMLESLPSCSYHED